MLYVPPATDWVPVNTAYWTVPPHVLPVGIAGFVVLNVFIVPLFDGVTVPNNWKVDMSNAPPAVVVNVPFTVSADVTTVFVADVFNKVKLLYVPPATDWTPVNAAYWTVPPQVLPVGIAGFVVFDVFIVPLFEGVTVPDNWKVDMSNVPPAAVVKVPLTVMAAAAVLVPLVLSSIKLL